MKSPDDANFQQWKENPEPKLPELDPQTILDCNVDGQAWMWHTSMDAGAWLKYDGNPVKLER